MIDKYTAFLKKQITKLDQDDFDLEAWKSATISALERIYDHKDPKIRQIEQLKIDYSSWALRDSNANYKPIETCRKKGREILNTAIDELEILGLDPTKEKEPSLERLPDNIRNILSENTQKERKKKLQNLKKEELISALLSLAE